MITIGKKIKELRCAAGFTQEVLGAMIGVSEKVISKWENETTLPSVEILPSLADAFKINIDDLFEHTHNDFTNLEQQVCDYLYMQSVDRAFSQSHKLMAYMTWGMKKCDMQNSECYNEDILTEIANNQKTWIEQEDERLQYFSSTSENAAWGKTAKDFRICVLQELSKQKLSELLEQDYAWLRKLFALLAKPDIEKVLQYFFVLDRSQTFTVSYLVEESGVCVETVNSFLEFLFALKQTTNETIIEKQKAMVDGNEMEIYHYFPGAFASILKSVLVTAFVFTGPKEGFR